MLMASLICDSSHTLHASRATDGLTDPCSRLPAQVTACAGFFVAEKPLLRRWSPLATLAYSYGLASTLMLGAAVLVNSTPLLEVR